MKIKVLNYDPEKGIGTYEVNGNKVRFRYTQFAYKMFIGNGELFQGKLYPKISTWDKIKKIMRMEAW